MARRFSAVISWRIWVPRIFSIELSAPGAPPATAATTPGLVVRMLASSISHPRQARGEVGVVGQRAAVAALARGRQLNRANAAVDCPTPAMLVRS